MDAQARKLKFYGMVLFLLGLIIGLVVMNLANPRMGLSAHLEGVMNGVFLLVVGLIWGELHLSEKLKTKVYYAVLFGTFVNWISTTLGAVLGTSKLTPIAGQGFVGSDFQEALVAIGLGAVAITMVFSASVLAYGLRSKK